MIDSNFLRNSPINFSFLTWDNEDNHFHEDIELIYVFDGELEIVVENSKYILIKDDFLIINSNKMHKFRAYKSALIGSFTISYVQLSELIRNKHIVFWCNSTIEKSSEYNEARRKISDFANDFIRSSESDLLNIISKFYELLYLLTKNFLITANDNTYNEVFDDEKQRVEQITKFISQNYRNRISLTDISEMLFLSDAYLSKYIKKHFGMNFSEYLNMVRLSHAIEDLLYSDIPIIRIALDNGFANISTFNKVFKDNYSITPSKYRLKYSKTSNKTKQVEGDLKVVIKKAEELFGIEKSKEVVDEKNLQIVSIDTTKREALKNVWNEMINIGAAEEVLRSDMQRHILDLKNKLNIKYVRIWGLYSPGMLLDINISNNSYNFHKIDKVLDFLIENKILPYLELNNKTRILIKSIGTVLIPDEEHIAFGDLDSLERFFNEFIIHIINRYGTESVSQWYFEFWKNERTIVQKIIDGIEIDPDQEYLEQFSLINKIFKGYIPEIKLGGAGLSARFGIDILRNTLNEWSKIEAQPDFLSFYSFPYIQEDNINDGLNKISTNRDFMSDYLKLVKECVEESGIIFKELHFTEWNVTVSNRNIFNDSCNKAAYVMKNIIDNYGSLDLMGYWFASDITADFYDSAFLINGGSGLVTRDGIRKPAFHAFEFLNRLGKKFIDKGENYIASSNGYKEWGIVCHNYKFYGYRFFTTKEDVIDYNNLNKYFENTDDLEMEYSLYGMEDGNYDIKIYSINNKYGSVQDEWIKMSCPQNLTFQEIEYLKRICVPHLNIINIVVNDGKLSFKTKLEANEIQYINIRYRLK